MNIDKNRFLEVNGKINNKIASILTQGKNDFSVRVDVYGTIEATMRIGEFDKSVNPKCVLCYNYKEDKFYMYDNYETFDYIYLSEDDFFGKFDEFIEEV